MNPTQPNSSADLGAARQAEARRGLLLGIPLGELGWFQSLLLGTAAGFTAFFASCFLSIVTLLALNTAGHRVFNYDISYRRVGFPVGLTVLIVAYLYLGSLWVRRKLSR
jgi:hypothetical protein